MVQCSRITSRIYISTYGLAFHFFVPLGVCSNDKTTWRLSIGDEMALYREEFLDEAMMPPMQEHVSSIIAR
jgi:hypothetical protein